MPTRRIGGAEAQNRATLDALRNVLATYPQQIERMRAEYRDRC